MSDILVLAENTQPKIIVDEKDVNIGITGPNGLPKVAVAGDSVKVAATGDSVKVTVSGNGIKIAVSTDTVKVITQQRGDRGLVGPGGPAHAFTHTQSIPAATWTINHNLGIFPTPVLFSTGGLVMIGTIVNVNNNQIQVQFEQPVAGTARLI